MASQTRPAGVCVIIPQQETYTEQTHDSTTKQQTGCVDNEGYDRLGDASNSLQIVPRSNVHIARRRRARAKNEDDTQDPNLIVTSICICICCSPLLGIIAIIFASMANKEFEAGNKEGGRKYNLYARISMGVTVAISVAVLIVYLVLSFAVFAFA